MHEAHKIGTNTKYSHVRSSCPLDRSSCPLDVCDWFLNSCRADKCSALSQYRLLSATAALS